VNETDSVTPRWVKVGGVIALVVVVLLVVLLVTGNHGPRRHGSDVVPAAPAL
jgi:hypothetical protein